MGVKGDAIHHSAEDLNLIRFLAGCGDLALTWFASIQFSLNRLLVELSRGGHPSKIATHLMGFTGC